MFTIEKYKTIMYTEVTGLQKIKKRGCLQLKNIKIIIFVYF